jgi:transposase-like protein
MEEANHDFLLSKLEGEFKAELVADYINYLATSKEFGAIKVALETKPQDEELLSIANNLNEKNAALLKKWITRAQATAQTRNRRIFS